MPHLIIPVNENDHHQGLITAPITLVEYGDYQCSLCRLSFPVLKQFQRELGGELCLVFRHFPLKESHPQAYLAATAAEAASLQNQFWEMHEGLYAKSFVLNPDNLLTLAQQLHLNLEKFEADRQAEAVIKKIDEDFKTGARSGVNGTPCFFINGERYDGNLSYNAFKQALLDAAKMA
jgi:protein-disulfide isomerase